MLTWFEAHWVSRATLSLAVLVVSYLGGHLVTLVVGRRLAALAANTKGQWDDVVVHELTRRVPFWSLLLGIYLAAGFWALPVKIETTLTKTLFVLVAASSTFFAAAVVRQLTVLYGSSLQQALPVTSLTQNIATGLVISIGLLIILNGLGLSITPILTALGVGGLAVALALQDTLANLFGGVYVSMGQQIRVGDYVKLDTGQEGYVADIGWRATRIRMLPNNIVLVPNAKLAQAIVTNYYLPERELSVSIEVGVDYRSDLTQVERVTCEVAKDTLQHVAGGIPDFNPFIRYHAFSDSSIDFTVILRAREYVDQVPAHARIHQAAAREVPARRHHDSFPNPNTRAAIRHVEWVQEGRPMGVMKRMGCATAAALAIGIAIVAGSFGPATAAQATADRTRFVGTYALVTTEVRDAATGKWVPTPNFNSIGYITFSDTGQMGVHLMPKVRAKFAGAQPTPEEAKAALQGYVAFFGTYTVDETNKNVVFHRVGQINPGGEVDTTRFYDFVPDPRDPKGGYERLILTPPPAGGGKAQATNRLVWERMPNAPLSAEAQKLVGVYKLLYTDSYRMKDGREVFHGDKVFARAGTSYIFYMPTGYMMVHLMNNSGRTKWAGAQPTPEEALATFRSYSGYFGRFITYEHSTPLFVVHSQLGTTAPGGYSEQKRFYQLADNVLRLGGPPRLNDAGEIAGGHLYWQRLGPGEK